MLTWLLSGAPVQPLLGSQRTLPPYHRCPGPSAGSDRGDNSCDKSPNGGHHHPHGHTAQIFSEFITCFHVDGFPDLRNHLGSSQGECHSILLLGNKMTYLLVWCHVISASVLSKRKKSAVRCHMPREQDKLPEFTQTRNLNFQGGGRGYSC